jgi:hypothetical protein
MDKLQILKNKIEAVNTLHDQINKVIPLILTRLNQGFKVNKDFQLYKKDKEDIEKILLTQKNIRMYVRSDKYSIQLHGDIYYPIDVHTVEYYKYNIYLFDGDMKGNYKEFPFIVPLKSDYKIFDILLRQNAIEELEQEKDTIDLQIKDEKEGYATFFN